MLGLVAMPHKNYLQKLSDWLLLWVEECYLKDTEILSLVPVNVTLFGN